ncbi:sn-1-specific diacylglycerol lipase ABHD11 [Parasteatoda tepidariorum]|uniref:sn-1-specific diacylglycerol lipase ABHD11 n=1 Tax=Parasteatoda tepidariorum TaxID=114398 RepID=A0A2L2Y6B9_PARTP|nr:protein ABHD11 [Parasteatoda tepidariorum]
MTESIPIKLSYKVFKPAGGKGKNLSPIIFIHGLSGSKENWIDIAQLIADGSQRTAYAYDARNHGDSQFTESFNFDLNVEDLFQFMDTIDVPKAVLVGHSMGGITAIRAALKNPERVEMVFIEDMFTKKLPAEILKFVSDFLKLWLVSVSEIPNDLDPDDAVKHALEDLYSKIPPDAPDVTEKEKLFNSGIQLKRSSDGSYDVKFNKDVIIPILTKIDEIMTEPVGQFDGPAYFIYGALSPFFVGKEEAHIKKHFPNAELIEFEGATHNVHFEFPEKLIETVLQRLKIN